MNAASGGGLGVAQAEAARVLISSLADAGVRDLVIAPGSRSTPLVLAAIAEPRLSIAELIDERAAAFFALGQARVSGRPSVLLTTSGTAGAHAYPAVLEAEASNLPLLVMTADRPLELQNCGALQTIDQRELFGRHVRACLEISLADRRGLERVAAQAVAYGLAHLNVKASKPLETELSSAPARSPLRISRGRVVPDAAMLDELSRYAEEHERGMIVAGPLPLSAVKMREAVFALSERTGWPLLAEATSQLRFTRTRPKTACDVFEPLLRSPRFRGANRPTFVLQLGAMPTSSAYDAWMRELDTESSGPGPRADRESLPFTRVIVAEHGVPDATSRANWVVNADPLEVVAGIRASRKPGSWAAGFVEEERRARAVIAAEVERGGEAAIAHAVVASLPDEALLMAGNGLPIRHLDLFASGDLSRAAVLSQRGASGIDGLISGAAGAASVAGCRRRSTRGDGWAGVAGPGAEDRPVVALLGDVSMLHDLHGLAAAKMIKTPLVLVVINNDGGRIFEQLPIGAHAASERFTTPHGTSFEHAAALFGVSYQSSGNATELRALLRSALQNPGATLIEARVGPHDARDAYARVWRSFP